MTLLFAGGNGEKRKEQTSHAMKESGGKKLHVPQKKPTDSENTMTTSLFRRRLSRHCRIPREIHCGPSPPPTGIQNNRAFSGSSRAETQEPTVDQKQKLSKQIEESPFSACVNLLESDCYEDQRIGVELLVVLVNRELVNSKREGSIAESLIFEKEDDDDDLSKRLRAVFRTFFYHQDTFYSDTQRPRVGKERTSGRKKDTETEGSDSTDDTSSFCSDLSNSTGRRCRPSFKIPALRAFVSCLELVARSATTQTLDLSHGFWQDMLAYLTESLEAINIEKIETALCVKGFRLLRTIDPQTLDPFLKESVLPFVSNAKEYGRSGGDKMLVRECDRFLKTASFPQ